MPHKRGSVPWPWSLSSASRHSKINRKTYFQNRRAGQGQKRSSTSPAGAPALRHVRLHLGRQETSISDTIRDRQLLILDQSRSVCQSGALRPTDLLSLLLVESLLARKNSASHRAVDLQRYRAPGAGYALPMFLPAPASHHQGSATPLFGRPEQHQSLLTLDGDWEQGWEGGSRPAAKSAPTSCALRFDNWFSNLFPNVALRD